MPAVARQNRAQPLERLRAMKPAPFVYVAARCLDHALALKSEHGDEAHFLAGGQSLVPVMNFRLVQPGVLIDINRITELDTVSLDARGVLRIGALTRHRTTERHEEIARRQPLLHEAMPHVAHPQIRNRGTIGGNLANADPASELPAVVLALGGRMRAKSAGGERWIAADDFFQGPLSTDLRPQEMLVEVELPPPLPGTGSCFMEVARRRGDFALMGVAAIVTIGEDGACAHCSLAYCSAGDRPVIAAEAARSLVGNQVTGTAIREAAALAQRAIDPSGNLHASKDFQRHLAGVLTRRALHTALARARDSRRRASDNGVRS
jgi:carbon-monoxide dehydrogenase medium subunit